MTVIVNCTKDKKNYFKKITVEGHSEYNKNEKDIVCSAISAITNGTINFLLKNYSVFEDINYLENKIIIETKKKNKECQLCLKLMIFQLENIKLYYPKHIKITFTIKEKDK